MRRLRLAAGLLVALIPTAALAQISPTLQGILISPGGTVNLAASTPATASLIVPSGQAPTTCTDGMEWKTSAGFFGCNGSQVVGPFGGNIGSGSANELAVYTGPQQIGGIQTTNNAVLISNGVGTPAWSTSLPPGVATPPAVYTIATLPFVTSANKGLLAFVTDCLNGTQTMGNGTGCLYVVDDTGAWIPNPSTPTGVIPFGGQNLVLGQTATVQGTGAVALVGTGSYTNGHGVVIDASGNIVDAGGAPTIGGGSGTVTASTQNSIAYFASSGSSATVSGLGIADNAVLSTNGSGVPSESTTLPSTLTIPSPTISNPALTGTATYAAMTGSGKLTTTASSNTAAGLNIPPGTAPGSPSNGDVWVTSSGFFGRVNGTTQSLIGTLNTTSPLGGGGTGPALTLTCTTCALTTNGGALTATAPVTISAAGVIALGLIPAPLVWIADSTTTVHNDTYNLIESWPFTNPGTVDSVIYHTGGTNTPSFKLAVQVNGSAVGSCTNLTVNSSGDTTTSCGGGAITNGQKLAIVLSSASGTPTTSVVQVNVHKPAS